MSLVRTLCLFAVLDISKMTANADKAGDSAVSATKVLDMSKTTANTYKAGDSAVSADKLLDISKMTANAAKAATMEKLESEKETIVQKLKSDSDEVALDTRIETSLDASVTCAQDIGQIEKCSFSTFLAECCRNAKPLTDGEVQKQIKKATEIQMRGIIMETTINGFTQRYMPDKGGHVIIQFVLVVPQSSWASFLSPSVKKPNKIVTFNLGLTVNDPGSKVGGPAGKPQQGGENRGVIGTAYSTKKRFVFQDITTVDAEGVPFGQSMRDVFNVRYATPAEDISARKKELIALVRDVATPQTYPFIAGVAGMTQGNCFTVARQFMKSLGYTLTAVYESPVGTFMDSGRPDQEADAKKYGTFLTPVRHFFDTNLTKGNPKWLIRSLNIAKS